MLAKKAAKAKKKLPAKNKGGAPTKYRPEYCDQLVEFMAKGYTATAFAGHIGVHRDTLNEWSRVHPAFSDAQKRGKAVCEKFLIDLGLSLINGDSKGSPAPWVFMMKNICGWQDKKEEVNDNQIRSVRIELPSQKAEQIITMEPKQIEE